MTVLAFLKVLAQKIVHQLYVVQIPEIYRHFKRIPLLFHLDLDLG